MSGWGGHSGSLAMPRARGFASPRVVRQNIALALGLKFVFLVLGLLGRSTLWMALGADDGAAMAAIANGLRILFHRENA